MGAAGQQTSQTVLVNGQPAKPVAGTGNPGVPELVVSLFCNPKDTADRLLSFSFEVSTKPRPVAPKLYVIQVRTLAKADGSPTPRNSPTTIGARFKKGYLVGKDRCPRTLVGRGKADDGKPAADNPTGTVIGPCRDQEIKIGGGWASSHGPVSRFQPIVVIIVPAGPKTNAEIADLMQKQQSVIDSRGTPGPVWVPWDQVPTPTPKPMPSTANGCPMVPSPANTNWARAKKGKTVTKTGYLIDRLCWNQAPVGGWTSNRLNSHQSALMRLFKIPPAGQDPQLHTVYCLMFPGCLGTGYVLVAPADGSEPKGHASTNATAYISWYRLDAAGVAAAYQLVQTLDDGKQCAPPKWDDRCGEEHDGDGIPTPLVTVTGTTDGCYGDHSANYETKSGYAKADADLATSGGPPAGAALTNMKIRWADKPTMKSIQGPADINGLSMKTFRSNSAKYNSWYKKATKKRPGEVSGSHISRLFKSFSSMQMWAVGLVVLGFLLQLCYGPSKYHFIGLAFGHGTYVINDWTGGYGSTAEPKDWRLRSGSKQPGVVDGSTGGYKPPRATLSDIGKMVG